MAKKKVKKNEEAVYVVKDCTFTGVKYDKGAIDAIAIVSQGLIENAKALGLLASALNASGIVLESMLKVGDDK